MSAERVIAIFCNSLLLLIFIIKKCVEFNVISFGTKKTAIKTNEIFSFLHLINNSFTTA